MNRTVTFELVAPARVRADGDLNVRVVAPLENVDQNTVTLTSARLVEFPRGEYGVVLAAATAEAGLVVRPVPPRVMGVVDAREARVAAAADVDAQWALVPPAVRARALPFQVEGIKRALVDGGRLLFGDEMGLGKTVQAVGVLAALLATASAAAPAPPAQALVLCPASLFDNWLDELQTWAPHLKCVRVRNGKTPVRWAAADVVVCSVDLAKLDTPNPVELRRRRWHVVVCDESHCLQSHTSDRSKKLLPVLVAAPHVMLLSGTPQSAMPAQLYVQLSALVGGSKPWMTWRAYSERYCDGKVNRFGQWEALGATRVAELALVMSCVMVRRLARDVLRDLPPLTRSVVELALPPHHALGLSAIRTKLDAARKEAADVGGAGVTTTTLSPLSTATAPPTKAQRDAQRAQNVLKQLTMEWWRETGRAKAPHVVAYVLEHVRATPRGEKTIVFCHHAFMREALMDALVRELGLGAVVAIHGGTPVTSRQELVGMVASRSGAARVAVLSLRACATGLNFTPAVRHEIFAELDFNGNVMMQAEKRAHRIGADGPVRAVYLAAGSGSIDERVLRTNKAKFDVNIAVLGSGSRMDVAERSSVDFVGSAFVSLGVLTKCGEAHPSTAPLEGETLAAFVRRTCVPVDAGDYFVQGLGTVRREVFDLNPVNAAAPAAAAMRNVDEWLEGEPPALDGAAVLWVLCAAPLADIAAVQALASAFERAEAVAGMDVVAVYARVVGVGAKGKAKARTKAVGARKRAKVEAEAGAGASSP